MNPMIDVLRAVSPIAHFTYWPDSDACGEERSMPPVIWLTFQQPSEELAKFLREAVSTFPGDIAWEFLTSGRWMLMPARINEFAASHGFDRGLIAAAQLKLAEPEFGKRANAELGLLAEHVLREWLKSQTDHLPKPGSEVSRRPAEHAQTRPPVPPDNLAKHYR